MLDGAVASVDASHRSSRPSARPTRSRATVAPPREALGRGSSRSGWTAVGRWVASVGPTPDCRVDDGRSVWHGPLDGDRARRIPNPPSRPGTLRAPSDRDQSARLVRGLVSSNDLYCTLDDRARRPGACSDRPSVVAPTRSRDVPPRRSRLRLPYASHDRRPVPDHRRRRCIDRREPTNPAAVAVVHDRRHAGPRHPHGAAARRVRPPGRRRPGPARHEPPAPSPDFGPVTRPCRRAPCRRHRHRPRTRRHRELSRRTVWARSHPGSPAGTAATRRPSPCPGRWPARSRA